MTRRKRMWHVSNVRNLLERLGDESGCAVQE
ncbi:hypothetical protein [Silicimonas algicola]